SEDGVLEVESVGGPVALGDRCAIRIEVLDIDRVRLPVALHNLQGAAVEGVAYDRAGGRESNSSGRLAEEEDVIAFVNGGAADSDLVGEPPALRDRETLQGDRAFAGHRDVVSRPVALADDRLGVGLNGGAGHPRDVVHIDPVNESVALGDVKEVGHFVVVDVYMVERTAALG